MHILIVTPAAQHSRRGNRVTADRWAGFLRELGHRVTVRKSYDGRSADALLALHARKSAAAVRRFRTDNRQRPIIVTLTGTDLYSDLPNSAAARRSLRLADRLIVLQEDALNHLPEEDRHKARVVVQSCIPPESRPAPLKTVFEVCVSGHLRSVKDPFRAEMAARLLPADSRIRITHIGAALSDAMRRSAESRMKANSRYRWRGEQSRSKARRILARSRVLVISSRLEGGANVVCEAIASQVPVLASRVSGNIGLLGADYGGYFEVGDTRALSELLYRAETDSGYYGKLQSRIRRLGRLVRPEREKKSIAAVLADL